MVTKATLEQLENVQRELAAQNYTINEQNRAYNAFKSDYDDMIKLAYLMAHKTALEYSLRPAEFVTEFSQNIKKVMVIDKQKLKQSL